MDIMLDLETMGVSDNAAIVSIGAVGMNLGSHIVLEDVCFYRRIDIRSSVLAGGVMDASTVQWWLQQDEVARKELYPGNGSDRLADVLNDFADWVEDNGVVGVWGNGSNFDNTILRNAYTRLHMPVPWDFHNDSCYRTMNRLYGDLINETPNKTMHTALSDAGQQAQRLVKIMKFLAT